MENDQEKLFAKTLIICAQGDSKLLDAYFFSIDPRFFSLFFASSYNKPWPKCSTAYQISDFDVFQRLVHPNKTDCGSIINPASDRFVPAFKKNKSSFFKIKNKHTPLSFFARKFLWKYKRWYTKELDQWIEAFKPQCIFLYFFNDTNMLDIADFFSKKYDLPIIVSINDDFLYNHSFSFDPLELIKRSVYSRSAKRILLNPRNSFVFINDEIADVYKHRLGIEGSVIHLSSEASFKKLPKPKAIRDIIYAGSLDYHRWSTIQTFAKACLKEKANIIINVYTFEKYKKELKSLRRFPNICIRPAIRSDEVPNTISKYDAVLLVEALTNRSAIRDVRYSLSTKTADSLASGKLCIGLGNKACGEMKYLSKNNCSLVATSKKEIIEIIRKCLLNNDYDWTLISQNAENCIKRDFSIQKNSKIIKEIFKKTEKNCPK